MVEVKTGKGRKVSSVKWLRRQLNDPYVKEAKKQGYRSRAAFKIMELDDQLRLFSPGMTVVDLGAAPGGWTEVAVKRVKSRPDSPSVVALDLLEIKPIEGAAIIKGDFNDFEAVEQIEQALSGRKVDLVLSDMAPNTTGNKEVDYLRLLNLVELAYYFAVKVLAPGGSFVAKVFQGGTENNLLAEMKRNFKTVKHIKPPASRKDSKEFYVGAFGFKG